MVEAQPLLADMSVAILTAIGRGHGQSRQYVLAVGRQHTSDPSATLYLDCAAGADSQRAGPLTRAR